MKLLITTQAVDLDDPILGFFHRWIEEFAKHCEQVSVICLKEGRHSLPANVSVYSLGKEGGPSRIKYIFRFYRYIWSLRHGYDSVFVHMNPEYAVLGGPLWRFLKKRIGLWYVHRRIGLWLRCGVFFSDVVFTATEESMRVRTPRRVVVGHGIDTNAFARGESAPDSVLFLGRFDKVKRPDIFLEAVALLTHEGTTLQADIYGEPTPGNEPYGRELRARFVGLRAVTFHSRVRNDETPALYAGHQVYVNLTPSGSFDKTIGEAMASGCIPVVANEALRGIIPDALIAVPDSVVDTARAIRAALNLPLPERSVLSERLHAYAQKEYSLNLLVTRICAAL